MSLFQDTGAHFSDCRKYRYVLWRIWEDSKPAIQFIGLNPSTASEQQDDPTIRRVIRFAKDWGYGGIYMTNLFAIVSSDPGILLTCEDPVGRNDDYLLEVARICKYDALFAWGNFKQAEQRAIVVSNMFAKPKVLGFNKNGSPKHPLYVPANVIPVPFHTQSQQ